MDGQAPVNVGDVLADKYRIERILGVGGMGVVVAATHLQLEQIVALKFMLPHALANYEAVQRFMREARSAVKLKSEHVARIIDVGTLPNTAPYIVMEYLHGTDLQTVLERQGPVPVQTAVDYVLQACEAIAEAHSHGIVHRDLKPANLFIARRPDGRPIVKVLDFGISKTGPGHSDFNMTQTAAVMGSPAYMSPEQMRSSKMTDMRSDIWALGVILYQATTGHVPFAAETFTELCLRVAMDPTPPMPTMPYAIPQQFEAVVRRCLEKDPAQRTQNVAELAQLLAPLGPQPQSYQMADRVHRVLLGETGAAAMAQSNPNLDSTGARVPTTLGGSSGQLMGKRRRSKAPLIGGLILVSGGLVGIIAAVSTSSGPATNPMAPPETKAAAQPAGEPPAPPPKPEPPKPEPPKPEPPKPAEVKLPEPAPVVIPTPPPPVAETPPPVAETPPVDDKKPVVDDKKKKGDKDKKKVVTSTTKPNDKPPDKPKPAYDPLNSPD